MSFIWLRCHRKIKERLAADEVLLGKSLSSVLSSWQPAPSDTVNIDWFAANPQMNEIFQRLNIPFRDATSKKSKAIRQYLFCDTTVKAWCDYFSFVLRDIKMQVACQPLSMTDLYNAFLTLYCLLYENDALAALLALPSLDSHIRDAINAAAEREGDGQFGEHRE